MAPRSQQTGASPSGSFHRRGRLTSGLAALALAVALACTTPAAAPGRPLITGVTNVEEEVPLAFARTRAAGAQFVRIPIYWEGIAPRTEPPDWRPEDPDDPHYHWSKTDQAVGDAVAAGLVPVLQVDGGPSWAQRCQPPDYARVDLCETDPADFGAFAVAAARHYDGGAGPPRVQYWQALNEPNLSLFFNPQYGAGDKPLSPDLYRDLLNAFYRGIKSVDPANLVIAGGLGPIAVPPWTVGPMRFARLLLCMHGHSHPRPNRGSCGSGVHFDIFAIQPYTTGGPTHEGRVNDVELGDLDKLQTLLRAADRAGRIEGAFRRTPLWITEFSWDSNPPDPGGLPMKIETRWVAEALHQSWLAGVTHFFWYSLRDGPHDGDPYGETLESGLYFRGTTIENDQPKEFLAAYRYPFVAYPTKKGLSFWGRTPDSLAHKVTIQVWKRRDWRRVTAIRASADGVFGGVVADSSYGRDRRGSVRAVYPGQPSVPFSMKPVPDFRQSPFG